MSDSTQHLDHYRELSNDMRAGLRRLYREIAEAGNLDKAPKDGGDEMFAEASVQLHEALETTEKATMRIMDLVERQMDWQMETAGILAEVAKGTHTPEQLARLNEINAALGEDLTEILTSLSFQDVTGQRIKKAARTLKQIEASVVDMYLTSGLMIDGVEKNPNRSPEDLRDEAHKAMAAFRESSHAVVDALNSVEDDHGLKGPSKAGCSQGAIDDMLAQLGM